jgi:hypothetical protein
LQAGIAGELLAWIHGKWCPGWESNPHEEKSPEDFKSSASAIPPPGPWHYKLSESKELVQHKRLREPRAQAVKHRRFKRSTRCCSSSDSPISLRSWLSHRQRGNLSGSFLSGPGGSRSAQRTPGTRNRSNFSMTGGPMDFRGNGLNT